MKKVWLGLVCAGVLFTACNSNKKKGLENNPLVSNWETPFAVPPFDRIQDEHYLPAFEEAMRIQMEEVNQIISNKEKPNFDNTIIALDQSGSLLTRTSNVFFNLASANTNEKLQEIEVALSPLLAKHSDDIQMNAKLFKKVEAVYLEKDKLNLNEEQKILLDKVYKSFVRSGVNLTGEKQVRMREINKRLSELMIRFGQNLLAETNGFKLIIDKEEDLKGLPENLVKTSQIEGKWVFGLQNPSVIPFLQYAENRDLREKIWKAWTNRANNNDAKDNKAVIQEIIKLRTERAQLLGYQNFALYELEERMAKNPEAVFALLNKIWVPALAKAKTEALELQKLLDKDHKGDTLQAWDWRYYTEKLRKLKYDLDEETQKPYFSLPRVRDGIFMVSNKLYGLTFTKITNLPLYQSDVETFEVKDKDGAHVGILYMDYYTRDNKRGGAWCTSFQDQHKKLDGTKVFPIVSIVCNFSTPLADQPSLLTYDEAETFFHEFGHVLHALMGDYTYNTTSQVPRDFVELPSQIMENWCSEPEVLRMYAHHYKTGECIPNELIKKINNAAKFNQGFATTEYVAASLLDMDYHVLTDTMPIKVAEFEKAMMDKIGLISQIPPRYRSTYFSHIFDGGYSAGYYSYLWSEVLDADAFNAFVEKGNIFDQETANKFKTEILMKGGSSDAMEMYKRFRGKDADVEALLKRRGLK